MAHESIIELTEDNFMDWTVASANSHLVGDLKKGKSGNLKNPSPKISKYLKATSIRRKEDGYPGDPDRTRVQQLRQTENLLKNEVKYIPLQIRIKEIFPVEFHVITSQLYTRMHEFTSADGESADSPHSTPPAALRVPRPAQVVAH